MMLAFILIQEVKRLFCILARMMPTVAALAFLLNCNVISFIPYLVQYYLYISPLFKVNASCFWNPSKLWWCDLFLNLLNYLWSCIFLKLLYLNVSKKHYKMHIHFLFLKISMLLKNTPLHEMFSYSEISKRSSQSILSDKRYFWK